jgi:hypothetical protein
MARESQTQLLPWLVGREPISGQGELDTTEASTGAWESREGPQPCLMNRGQRKLGGEATPVC